ncbi:xanthine dehydrogenase accessory protein XdhC [Mangrovimicrobium sediminis]|nr:xanthine dehydrogenase accessory protein XdhC [Haliea sp. SAOS-164]
MPMRDSHWSEAVARLQAAGEAYALVTVMATAGSTPRERGAKMVVSAADTYASIGGGQLEYLVVQRARECLAAGQALQEVKQFPLAAEAQQCCGGSVAIFIETFVPQRREVCLFGAGHVAAALAGILVQTETRVTCIDNRAELLAQLPAGERLQCLFEAQPEDAVARLPAGASVFVLTHDHALDYRLVSALLQRGGWRRLGLIGSQTKSLRFRHRLGRDGFSEAQLAALECPVGLPEVQGKLPMEVAVSIAASILAEPVAATDTDAAMGWPQMRAALRDTEQSS